MYNINIKQIQVEWDDDKNKTNIKKHGIAFDEAWTVFYDEAALIISDPDHSQDEDRFLILGFSAAANMLVVSHCYRKQDDIIRIISARKATKKESEQYRKRLE